MSRKSSLIRELFLIKENEMAQQPVFVTINDVNGPCGQSRSRRKKVEWVELWVNTMHGPMLIGTVTATGGTIHLSPKFRVTIDKHEVIHIRLREEHQS